MVGLTQRLGFPTISLLREHEATGRTILVRDGSDGLNISSKRPRDTG